MKISVIRMITVSTQPPRNPAIKPSTVPKEVLIATAAAVDQAIKDAERFVADRVLDLEASCYEKEFTYWAEKTKRSR